MKLNDYLTNTTQSELASMLGITQSMISQWCNSSRPISPIQCVAIEQATKGKVSRKDLRPDDWHLIWPELSTKKPLKAA